MSLITYFILGILLVTTVCFLVLWLTTPVTLTNRSHLVASSPERLLFMGTPHPSSATNVKSTNHNFLLECDFINNQVTTLLDNYKYEEVPVDSLWDKWNTQTSFEVTWSEDFWSNTPQAHRRAMTITPQTRYYGTITWAQDTATERGIIDLTPSTLSKIHNLLGEHRNTIYTNTVSRYR